MQKKYKTLNILVLVMLFAQMFAPITAFAASGSNDNNQYFMLTTINNETDNSYGLKTIMQTDKSQAIVDGSSYNYESAQSNFHSNSYPIIDASKYSGPGSTYSSYIKNAPSDTTTFPNSWNGLSDSSMFDNTRYAASPEEGQYGLQVSQYLAGQLQAAYEYIAFGQGYKTSSYTDVEYIKDLANIAECSRAVFSDKTNYCTSDTIPLSKDSSMYGATGVSNDVSYTIEKPNPNNVEDAKMLNDFQMPGFYNSSLDATAKSKLLVKITVTSPDGSGEKKSALFAYRLSKGYSSGESLNSAIKNAVSDVYPDKTESELKTETQTQAATLPSYYHWSYIMEMVMYSYAEGDVKTYADVYKLQDTTDSCTGNTDGVGKWFYTKSPMYMACIASATSGAAVYYGILGIFGIPSIPDFISPYGEFSSWFYGFIPPNLTGFVFFLFGIMVIFAAVTKTFTLLAKYRNADKSADQHSEFKDYAKSIGLYVITLIFFVVLMFVFLRLYDYVAQAIWLSLNGNEVGDVIGSNPKLRLTPGDLTGTGALVFSFFYIFGTATWYLSLVFIKFRLWLTLILSPVIAEEIVTTDNETSGFNRFVELFVDTFVVQFINLMAFLLLYIVGNSTLGGTTIVLAVFTLGICASLFTIVMKRLGITKRLLNLPEGAIFTGMATSAMKSMTNEAQSVAKGAGNAVGGAAAGLDREVADSARDAKGALKSLDTDEHMLSAKDDKNALKKELMAGKLNELQQAQPGIDEANQEKLNKAQALHGTAAALNLLGGNVGGALNEGISSHKSGLGAQAINGQGNKLATPLVAKSDDLEAEISDTTTSKTGNYTADTYDMEMKSTDGSTKYDIDGNDLVASTNLSSLNDSSSFTDDYLAGANVGVNDYLSGAHNVDGDIVKANMANNEFSGASRSFEAGGIPMTANYDTDGNFVDFANDDMLTDSQRAAGHDYLSDRGALSMTPEVMSQTSSIQEERMSAISESLAQPNNEILAASKKTVGGIQPSTFSGGGTGATIKFDESGSAIMKTSTAINPANVKVTDSGSGYKGTFDNGRAYVSEGQKLQKAVQKSKVNPMTATAARTTEADVMEAAVKSSNS